MKILVLILLTTILLIILDLIWFSISTPMYSQTILLIQKTPLEKNKFIVGGLITWLLIAIGINIFVLNHANTTKEAVLQGALFGLITYGIFNGTNYAIFKMWDLKTSSIDTLWGIFICTVVSGIMFRLKSIY